METEEWLPGSYPSRVMCDVLDEIRTYVKLFPLELHLLGLIEEAQTIANRMEARLSDKKNYYELQKILREKIKTLRFPKEG